MPTATDPALFARASALLDELLDLDGDRRAARLAQLGQGEPALAGEVASLLAADAAAGDFLERPAESALETWLPEIAGTGVEPLRLPPGAAIGAWRVIGLLGTGGMGEVYEVERADGAFEKRAAAKLLKRGLDSAAILARFAAEKRILARLEHPAIARLHDGGIAADGRPFYVMELVRGRTLVDACLELPLAARIERFLVVCDAVEAAHRALVVHRDLKPSNVLVSDAGEVKLLDFGIAKLLDPEAGALVTELEARAMTPAYAAPEQILGEPITTATDVYALGALLFELLTGRVALERRTSGRGDLATAVEHETVERPSSVVRRIRNGSAARLARGIEGDLDAIVLRALAREPERRYRSAAALADDLRRHLAGRPIEARPDSLAYRTARFVRRNRLAVAAAAMVVASLVGGLTTALVSAGRARNEARRADAAAAVARAESERAQRIKEFVLSIIREADPMQRAQGRPLSATELVDAAERRIESELADDPLVQADLWDDLAEARVASGDVAGGIRLVERALAVKRERLPANDRSIAESLANRASFAAFDSKPEECLAFANEARAALEATGGSESRLGAELATIRTHALNQLGRIEEALAEARRAWELHRRFTGEGKTETVMQLSNAASFELKLGRPEDARATYRQVIAAVERASGSDHAYLFYPLRGLGRAELALGRLDAAEAAQRRALAIGTEQLGERSWMAGVTHHELGRIAQARGRSADARVLLETARAMLLESAPNRPELAQIEQELAALDSSR